MNIRYQRFRIHGSWVAFAGAAALLVAGVASAAEPGTWQSHQTTFNYLGISPTYSCEGLQDSLSYLLKKSGARLDEPVVAEPCGGGFGRPSQLIYAKLKFSTLKPAGTENSNAAQPAVSGAWRQVTISPQTSGFALRGSDCELVQEFKDKILPMLPVRDVKDNLHCVPHQTTGYRFGLSFEVFAPSA